MAKRKLKELIPSKVRVTSKVAYEVLFTDAFPNINQAGECRPTEKQIIIENGQSDTETWSTFLHEVAHSWSFEYGEKAPLTETQVLWLEKAMKNFLRLNKLV